MEKMSLGVYLQRLLQKKGLNMKELSDKTVGLGSKVSHVYIGYLVNDYDPKTGRRPNPSFDKMIVLGKALNVDPRNFMLAHQGIDPEEGNVQEEVKKDLFLRAVKQALEDL